MAQQATTNELRGGMKVEIDNQPYNVITNEFVKPGKGQAFNRIRLKHLVSGRVVDKVYKSGEKLDLADIVESQMRMLYREADGVVFMDDTSFEQVQIPTSALESVNQWLKEDLVYDVVFYKGTPVTVEPPTFMELIVSETAPGLKGDTATGGRMMKPGKLETGLEIKVPIFINEGEKIKVDTRNSEYVSRV